MSGNPRVVVITGSGRGIGSTIARAFAKEGDKVVVADLVAQRAQDVALEITAAGGEAMAVEVDVRSEPSVAAMFDTIIAAHGRVDVLINGAGSYGAPFRATHETPSEEWDTVVDSNLKGSFLCAKFAIPHMMRTGGGRIINFSSNAGRSVSPLLGASYTAAKTGVIGLSRHLSREYAAHNILVNTIAPGPVNGERVNGLIGNGDNSPQAELAATIPLGRLAESDDISSVVMFMASDASRFMTGAILDVNGGYVLP